jgi:hypothetical protein
MSSRALSLAAVMLLIGYLAPVPALAQAQNLEAGKSPSQIFAGTCTACHKGPRGLLKTVPASSLHTFLRQHYTTSPEMASLLAGFLVSNGATDTRQVGAQPRPGKDEKSEVRAGAADQLDRFGRRVRRETPQEAAIPQPESRTPRPDGEAASEPGRQGRNLRRLARPADASPAEIQDPVQGTEDRGPDGRRLSAKQKLSKRTKPASGDELPKSDAAKSESGNEQASKGEPAQSDTAKSEAKGETANGANPTTEDRKPDGLKPAATDDKAQSATAETPKDDAAARAQRPDPASQLTPAPPPPMPASASAGERSPAAIPTQQSPTQSAMAPVLAPVTPAGPPAPPISR